MCDREKRIVCLCRFLSATRTDPVSGSDCQSVGAALRPIMGFSVSATYRVQGASSPSTCRDTRRLFQPRTPAWRPSSRQSKTNSGPARFRSLTVTQCCDSSGVALRFCLGVGALERCDVFSQGPLGAPLAENGSGNSRTKKTVRTATPSQIDGDKVAIVAASKRSYSSLTRHSTCSYAVRAQRGEHRDATALKEQHKIDPSPSLARKCTHNNDGSKSYEIPTINDTIFCNRATTRPVVTPLTMSRLYDLLAAKGQTKTTPRSTPKVWPSESPRCSLKFSRTV